MGGISIPRERAMRSPTGSMDAARNEPTNTSFGGPGTSEGNTSIRTQIQESRPASASGCH